MFVLFFFLVVKDTHISSLPYSIYKMADINFDEEIALIDQQVKNDIPVTNNTIAPPVPIKRKIKNVSEEEPEEDGRDLFINNLSANMLTDIKTRPTDLELL